MFFDCKADFIAYALLSSFEIITEADRDAVEYTLELVASYVSNYVCRCRSWPVLIK